MVAGRKTLVVGLGTVWLGAAAAGLAEQDGPSGVQRVTSVALAPAPSAEQVLGGYDARAVERLRREGFVMVDAADPRQGLAALVLFHQPREKAFRLLSQSERQIEFRPELSSITTVERTPEGPVDEHHLRILFIQIAYRLQYVVDYPHRVMRWSLSPDFPNGIEQASGYWELFEFSGGAETLGRFGAAVRVGKGLPTWLQDSVSRTKVPDTLDATRRWVDSSGTWRP